jgi:hypothetical protein
MTKRGLGVTAAVTIVVASGAAGGVARAQPAPAPVTTDAPPPDDDDGGTGTEPGLINPQHHAGAGAVRGGHYHQIGVGFQFGLGMRGINPYTDGAYCGKRGQNGGANEAYCLDRSPAALDLELTYGIKPETELLLEIRLGLERDFGAAPGVEGPRVHHFAPGARFFFADTGRAKFFSTIQAVIDITGYEKATGGTYGTDLGLRNVNGFWFDVHHAYGFYAFFGEELGIKRWLSAGLEAGLGVQGRYP